MGRINRQNVVETLTEIDPQDGSIKPRLATSWQKVNDTTWRFNLREGVSYTDGAPLDAETVAKSISRTMDTELACLVRTSAFGDLKLVSKPVGKYVLDIVTSKPDPILPTRMGIVPMTSPATADDKLTNTPIGTGPYLYDSWTTGQEVRLKRNPAYWGAAPQVEAARYVWRNESSVRASMVKIGEAQIAVEISQQDSIERETDPKRGT